METKIVKRNLNNDEIDQLIADVKRVPQLMAGDRKRWRKYTYFYVLFVDDFFAGVCAVVTLKNWIKLGPFVVLEKYRGKGLGKIIMSQITKDYSSENIFIGSPTPAVWRIISNLGFKEVPIWHLPWEIKKYMIDNIAQSLANITIVKEFIGKREFKREKYRCFLKTHSS